MQVSCFILRPFAFPFSQALLWRTISKTALKITDLCLAPSHVHAYLTQDEGSNFPLGLNEAGICVGGTQMAKMLGKPLEIEVLTSRNCVLLTSIWVRNRFFPSKASRWECSPAKTLIETLKPRFHLVKLRLDSWPIAIEIMCVDSGCKVHNKVLMRQ